MAWLTIHHYSMVLGLQTTTEVLLPEPDQGIGVTGAVWDGKSDLPVLYLLHGSSDDSTIWMRRTSVERYNAGRRLAIVIPSCGKSMYVNQKYGYDYYTYLTEELPQIVSRFCRISTKREDSYISGLSMGGYGCLLAGLKNPEKYSKVACQSGMVDADAFISFQEFKKYSEDIYYFAAYGAKDEYFVVFVQTDDEKLDRNKEYDGVLYITSGNKVNQRVLGNRSKKIILKDSLREALQYVNK